MNFAVNNDGDYYPRITATAVGPGTSPAKLIDGNAWYDVHPPNRWTAVDSKNAQDELQLDLGMSRPVHTVKLSKHRMASFLVWLLITVDGDSLLANPLFC